jgi:hypothetical protein
LEVVGSVKEPPLQIGATCVKVGVTGLFVTTTVVEEEELHGAVPIV